MISALPVSEHKNLSGGMLSNVADSVMPDGSASLSVNFHYDVLGMAIQRSGTTVLGATVASNTTCSGLFQYIDSAGSTNRLFAKFGTTTYVYNGTTWTSLGESLSSAKCRFAQFLNLAFRVGGGSTTVSSTGAGFGSTNCSGAPSGKFIMPYKQRLYIAGDTTYPDRLFFSSIASSTSTITWNQTTQYLDVNPEDGNNITGLAKVSNLLLIFKERAMYRWNGTSTDPDIVVDIGTTSQESIAQVKGTVYFFNPSGIFATNGGYPMEISRPIYNWIQGMSASYYTEVSGFGDEDHYYCNIGTTTVNGRTFTNTWLVYTISSQNWHVYTFADSFRFMTRYINSSSAVTYVGGDTGGDVQTLFSGNTDNTAPIVYEYEAKDEDWGSNASTKCITELAVFMKQGLGGTVSISEDGKPYESVGKINNAVSIIKGINKRGHSLRVKIFGSNKSTPVKLEGYAFLKGENLGILTKN